VGLELGQVDYHIGLQRLPGQGYLTKRLTDIDQHGLLERADLNIQRLQGIFEAALFEKTRKRAGCRTVCNQYRRTPFQRVLARSCHDAGMGQNRALRTGRQQKIRFDQHPVAGGDFLTPASVHQLKNSVFKLVSGIG